MAGSTVTVPVAQFAQQLRQKYPQYSSVPDDKLVAAFVSKNPRYTANYEGTALVSVSFEPSDAAAPAQKPGVTASVQSLTASTGMNGQNPASVAAPVRSNISASGTIARQATAGSMNAAEASVVRPATPVAASGSAAAAQPALQAGAPSGEPYLGSTVIMNAEAISTPPMVGKYQVVDELGRGGMGVVYKAFDPGIGRTVALKLMSEQLARDTDFRERFLREARGAGILQHPNIVTVHELGEWQGAPFIAMEFLQGRSLEDMLKQEEATTPLQKRLDIVAQVCRGLDYAPARGIVHRDIKPANVMVTTDGVAKVVDFGIARLADQKLTNTGHVLGTVSYMSPEQLQGKALDGRSDIFAVGVMLFEALTSVLPFAADDTGAAITNTLYRQPPNLSNFLANYPKGLDDVLRKCLAKDPAERFQTAGELADRLTQVQQEIQQSQTAPTVIRSTPLPNDHSDSSLGEPSPKLTSTAAASEQIQQVATKSAEFAQQWWKVATPRARRNVVTVACAAVLYLIAIPLVWLPIALLAAIVLAAQAGRKLLSSASIQAQVGVGVLVTAVAAFCCTKLATGFMWYIGFNGNRLMAVPVLAVVATIIGANGGLASDWWKSASGRARLVGAVVTVFLTVCFAVSAMSWSSTPKSYFAKGGEFEQREKTNQIILKAQQEAYDSTPLQIWTDSSLLARVQFYRHRLMWTNKDNGKRLSWAESKDYCGTLRLGGYSDWRLPSVDELKRISEGKRAFDESVAIYHLKKGIFLSDPSIWSSTEGTGFDFGTEDDIGGHALCARVDNGHPPAQSPAPSALATGQASSTSTDPSPNTQSTQPTASVEGIWNDSSTGLMWESESAKSDRNWPEADSYCRDLRLGNFSDWRLGTLDELESVADKVSFSSASSPYLKPPSTVIWSGQRTANLREAWYFYFISGATKRRYTLLVNDTHHGAHALCVRGAFNGNFHNSEVEAAEKQRAERALYQRREQAYASTARGVWTDPSVKTLMWMSKDNGRPIRWMDAESYCRASRLSGYSDWRLPTVGELKGLYDPKARAEGITYGTKQGVYASSPVIWSSEEVTVVSFNDGTSSLNSSTAPVLCVRPTS
jgi:serine/threonine protein kinase